MPTKEQIEQEEDVSLETDKVFGTSYSREQFIKILENGDCPICGKTSFKMVLGHIQQKHNILSKELKDELLISTHISFLEESLKETMRKNSEKSGFKKGHKIKNKYVGHNDIVRKKLHFRSSSNKNIQHLKMARQKIDRVYSEKRRMIAQFGTEEGYPEIFWANVANEFVKFLSSGSHRNVYARISKSTGVNKMTVIARIKTATKKGMLINTSKVRDPDGELTEKAKKILGKRVMNNCGCKVEE